MSEQLPETNPELIMGEYSAVEQKKYKNGAVHIYGVDPSTGKRSHVSHEEVLNAYGHSPKEWEQYNKEFAATAQLGEEDEAEDLDQELAEEWNDLQESFAEAKRTGDITVLQEALAAYKVYIEQFEDMSEDDKKAALKELLEGEVYVGKHEKPKDDSGDEEPSKAKEEKTKQAIAHNVGDEFEQMLEGGATKVWAIANISTDENGNTVYRLVDENLEENLSVTADELSDFNALTSSATSSKEEGPAVNRTLRQRVGERFNTLGAAMTADVQARLANSSPERSRRWRRVAIGAGILVVAVIAAKYGFDHINADDAQSVAESANAAGGVKPPSAEAASTLSKTQKELLSADGAYPWDRFAEVFGKKMANSEIFEAVDKLQAQGVKIIEHGSRNSAQYWIEVPKPGGGMTSNTDTVMRVLTKGV